MIPGVDAGLQLLTGTAGGAVAGWFVAFMLRKDKDILHGEKEVLAKQFLEAQNARITALEIGHKACEDKFNLLLQHVLSKGV